MQLGTPKLGEQYDFYATSSKDIGLNAIRSKRPVLKSNELIVRGTIVGIMESSFLCGFKEEVGGISFYFNGYLKNSVHQDHINRGLKKIDGFESFIGGTWIKTHYEIAGGPYAQSGNSQPLNNHPCPSCHRMCSAPPIETKCWWCEGKL